MNDGFDQHRADLVELLGIAEILKRLVRIERILKEGKKTMGALDDKLTALQAQLTDLADDLARELADLTNALAGNLTPEQEASLQAVTDKVAAMKVAIDTADPPPITQ